MDVEENDRARGRIVVGNESERQATSAVRVSSFAIIVAVLVIGCGLVVGYFLLKR